MSNHWTGTYANTLLGPELERGDGRSGAATFGAVCGRPAAGVRFQAGVTAERLSNMADESTFRIALLIVAVIQASVGFFYVARVKERQFLRRRHEGVARSVALAVFYAGCCVGVVGYLINPGWMAGSAIEIPSYVRWTGVALLVFGAALTIWGLHHLGANLTLSPATKQQHTLVTTGPYRWMRHPLYTAFLIGAAGVSLLMANWFVAVTSGACGTLLVLRTRLEEENLVKAFGDEYRHYMQRVGRFLPRMK